MKLVLILVCFFITILIAFLLIYLLEKNSFKSLRPLKTLIKNSSESSNTKLKLYDQINLNKEFLFKINNLDLNKFSESSIKMAEHYVSKIMHQDLRNLIYCTGEYTSGLTFITVDTYIEKAEKKRYSLMKDIIDSNEIMKKSNFNKPPKTIVSNTNTEIEELVFKIRMGSETLNSVISKSLYLNALTLKEKYDLAFKDETKLKIVQQLKDIYSFIEKDIEVVVDNKDKLIVNDLAINDIYLKDLETSWNQE